MWKEVACRPLAGVHDESHMQLPQDDRNLTTETRDGIHTPCSDAASGPLGLTDDELKQVAGGRVGDHSI
jgi:hypothetical protein